MVVIKIFLTSRTASECTVRIFKNFLNCVINPLNFMPRYSLCLRNKHRHSLGLNFYTVKYPTALHFGMQAIANNWPYKVTFCMQTNGKLSFKYLINHYQHVVNFTHCNTENLVQRCPCTNMMFTVSKLT